MGFGKSPRLSLSGDTLAPIALRKNGAFWLLAGCITLLLLLSTYILLERKQESDGWWWNQTAITAFDQGVIYYGLERVRKEDVPERVRQTRERLGRHRLIHVQAVDLLNYGTAVSVVAAVQAAGHRRIGLSLYQWHGGHRRSTLDFASGNLFPLEIAVLADDVAVSQLDSDSATSSPPPPDQRFAHPRIVVEAQSMDSNISLSLDSRPVPLMDLRPAVRRSLNSAPEAELWFAAPPALPIEKIMPLLNAIKNGGATTVTLAVSP